MDRYFMKYKFFGILVLMLFSVFLNANYVGAQISPNSGITIDSIGVSVSGSNVTVDVAGKLSVRSVSPQCFNAPEFPVTYSWNSESADTGTVNITSTAGATLSGAIPVIITPSSVSDGDCFKKAISYTFSGQRIFTGVSAGTHTVTATVTDSFGQTASKVSGSFTVVSNLHTATASVSGVGVSITSTNPVKNIVDGNRASFTLNANSGYSISPDVTGNCPVNLSDSPSDGSYSTGIFSTVDPVNCTVGFSSMQIPLSCAVDTATTPAPHYTNQGVKILATGGTGTYSWSAPGATPSTGTGNQIWPIYSTAGTKTISVTSGTTASCTVDIVAPTTPVDGVCATTHYNCSAGTSANNVGGTSGPWTWDCVGSGGGTTDSCSEATGMSGTLTASNCVIDAGSGSCTTDLNWTTTNPIATSSVTTPTSVTVGTGNNNSAIWQVVYGVRDFYLYNNGVLLATATANATCVAGTSWNGSVCETTSVTEPDLIASAPTPNIATVNVARTFSTNISNIGGASTVNSFSNFFQIAPAANGVGTPVNLDSASTTALASGATHAITSPSYTFTTTGTYSVRACADKTNPASTGTIAEKDENNNCSAWTNVTVSATAGTISGYHDAYSGTVPASQCRADGWAVYSGDLGLDVNVRILSDGTQVATGVASTYRGDLEGAGVCTGGTCSYWINLSGLISPGVNHTITAQGQNPANGAWTTLTASPKTLNCAAPTTGTLTASNCTIPSGGSSCNTSLTWTTTNPVGTSNITSNTPSANTIITTGNSGTNFSVSVPYSSRTFFLNNNAVALVSVTPTATCVSGTSWDESKCAVNPPPAVCGNGVVEGSESCDLGGGNGACPSTCSTSCTTNVCGGGSVTGVCSDPDNRLTPCLSGDASAITNGISSWTWTCAGQNGGASASCEELKKKPIIIED